MFRLGGPGEGKVGASGSDRRGGRKGGGEGGKQTRGMAGQVEVLSAPRDVELVAPSSLPANSSGPSAGTSRL